MSGIKVKEATIDEVLQVQALIPEFTNSYTKEEYTKRLSKTESLILVAHVNAQPVGFKVGYKLDQNVFYSWMGGVVPQYRQKSVVQHLAKTQELWAKEKGFKIIRFKTRNHLKPMLVFGLKNGFYITDIIRKDYPTTNYRIILEKNI